MGLMFNTEKSDYPAYEYLIVGLYEGLSLFASWHMLGHLLHRMRRCYSLDDYQRAINLIRGAILGVAITTDLMVGFPWGER